MNPVLHLAGEAFHHAVDHNQNPYAEGDADDRRQGDVSRAKIPPTEKQFIHGSEYSMKYE
jgi:hypothetical protein